MSEATLAILAGGESRRMGRPKAELRIGDQPVLEYLLDRFAWPGPTLLVTAPGREHPSGWRRFDREVADPVAGQGPLLGVLTALEATRTDVLVVTPCDMPRLDSRHLAWVIDALAQHSASVVMLTGAGQVQPFPLAIRTTVHANLRAHLDREDRSVRSLARIPGAVLIPAPGTWQAEAWTNLNNPSDLSLLDE